MPMVQMNQFRSALEEIFARKGEQAPKVITKLEALTEARELESLLAESFFVPRNEGVAPTAAYNRAKDADGVPVLKTWVYPAYKAFRTYQFKMVRAALFQNTLVTLPTGLGKTFIAATVMLNFYRWFSDG